MKKEWIFESSNPSEKSLIKRLLYSRGIKTEQEIHEFLHPLEMTLTSPNVFTDMEKAVNRLSKAIDEKENILIYGDFDADGVTSTSLLLRTFKYLGAEIDFYIPNRDGEGHGLNSKALVQILSQKKPKLIITVDNGISNVDEVKFELLNDKYTDKVICVGRDRYDIATRMKYAGFTNKQIKIYENLEEAKEMIKEKSNGDIFAILNFDYVNPFNELMKEDL